MTIWDRIKRAWCERFHAGGYVCRDRLGRINWKCDTCGRFANPVTHEDERRVVDAKIEEYRRASEVAERHKDYARSRDLCGPHRFKANLIETLGTDCVVCGRPIWDGIHDTRKENV
ncbi:hypothetical protein T8A63_07200 [Sulfitobacter sp. OXR-159]|uniref:hypothetical protein n=1 Tax=Sulfitobacter sp. OXR-159 TaxID=3100174 RepID=UPI002AC902D3|nr:hypothetical protein [Sulfitobacter sp. OXR-159]WPZ30742.1 hypothetical protein T8A63_06690 [Sulfitobacter sp. OXR-159]WPZ30843.1 hypothetical protein T8A63_07200 [Sulfitobacter sp. OXR-159]